jgi:hypothetical protein
MIIGSVKKKLMFIGFYFLGMVLNICALNVKYIHEINFTVILIAIKQNIQQA